VTSVCRHISGTACAVACVALAAGCGGGGSSPQGSGVLVGAGSTLVAPLVARWSGAYAKQHDLTVTYGGIGSGGGIAQATARTVDFGASDAPLQPDQKSAAPGLVQIPWALAATVVAVNVPGVAGRLRLTGPVLADIYAGRITTWNDPRIAALNGGVTLPKLRIAVVYRSDASGDTYVFTSYLSRVSATWRSKVGAGTEVSWPTGSGGKGNAGVTAALTQTRGSIAYIAIGQATASHLGYALVRNAAGRYPEPSPSTIAAAARTAAFAPDHSATIVDPPASARNAYPLSTFTYALVPKGSSKASTLKPFLRYAVGAGQSFAEQLSFAPLPANVRAADLRVIAGL
jgi:phosphate transport system substrate-binding protein